MGLGLVLVLASYRALYGILNELEESTDHPSRIHVSGCCSHMAQMPSISSDSHAFQDLPRDSGLESSNIVGY